MRRREIKYFIMNELTVPSAAKINEATVALRQARVKAIQVWKATSPLVC